MNSEQFCIILCTYNPNINFLKKQINSIINQTYPKWICIIMDDSSDEEYILKIESIIRNNNKFCLYKNDRNINVYYNFERGLYHVPKNISYICFSDQDDIWHPQKLEIIAQRFSEDKEIQLIHSDLELINEKDEVIYPSCFKYENRYIYDTSVEYLIMKNTITGCTCAFRYNLLNYILPFPFQEKINFYHDLWVALHASMKGKISVIPKALVQYRQHNQNILGAQKKAHLNIFSIRNFIYESYYTFMVRKSIAISLLNRCSNNEKQLKKIKVWLRNYPISLNHISLLIKQFIRKDSASVYCCKAIIGKSIYFANKVRKSRTIINLFKKFLSLDKNNIKKNAHHFCDTMNPACKALNIPYLNDSDEKGINILLTSLSIETIYGGASTAIKIGYEFLKYGYTVRFLTINKQLKYSECHETSKRLIQEYDVNMKFSKKLMVVSATNNDEVKCLSKNDIFVSTIWWSAHVAHNTLKKYNFINKKFIYLIQDFEPGFYPWSTEYSLSLQTYTFNIIPLYNTNLLANYFKNKIKALVYEQLILKPAIDTKLFYPDQEFLLNQKNRKTTICIYGRPNTPRNLFEIIIYSLNLWIKKNNFSTDDIEIISIGEHHPNYIIHNDLKIKSMGKLSIHEYASCLRKADIGISLMLSPHPSYPPLEMAMSGMLTITNIFQNKKLILSENFINCAPIANDICKGLNQAYQQSVNFDRRLRGSKFDLSDLGLPYEKVVQNLIRKFSVFYS